jgi:hypothetical protein
LGILRFQGARLHGFRYSTLKMEAEDSSVTLITIYRTKGHHILFCPEEGKCILIRNVHNHLPD